MKKYVILYISLLSNLCGYSQGEVNLGEGAMQNGGSVTACVKITLEPKFSFKADSKKSLSLKVSPTTCDPFNGEDINREKIKTENYTRTKTFFNADGSRYLDVIQYFDGLGRPVETIQRGITPKAKDLVAVQEYDGIGRDSKSWLPASIADNNGNFIALSTAKSSIQKAYNDSAYSRPVYESSPANRILEQYGPGKAWYNNKARVTNSYKTNTASGNLACAKYIVIGTTGVPKLKKSGNYTANQLYITETSDEVGNITYEFKDRQGKILLSRQINDSKNHDTYYVYDNWGNLCFVLPPLASDALTADNTEWSETNENLKHYAYMYRYDHRNRCVKKKLPGLDFGWIHMVYDKSDRLIFVQDGEQRGRKEWTFSIPDEMGRIRISGTCKDTINVYKKLMIAEYTGNAAYSGYTIKVDGTVQTLTGPDILIVNFYDNYKYQTLEEIKNLGLGYTNQSGFGSRYGDNSDLIKHKGLLTGSIEKILGETNKLYSAMYYDFNKRNIQSKSTNHLKGVESQYIGYDYVGNILQRLHIHTVSGQATQTELYTYTYDHAGRLLTTKHKLNSSTEVLLAQNIYDELGRLSSTTANNQSKLQTSYSYNIRSWATNIANTHFIENLTYNYNGNISSQEWTQANKTRKYAFAYDNLSQVKSATYTGDGRYGTSYIYDKHGNITSLKRNSSEGLVDNLAFEYTGNQLKKVTDAGVKSQSSVSADFKDYANVASEYAFNSNGAMTKDLNKGIQGISYNSANFPQEMVINHTTARAKNYYTYTAMGAKIKTVQKYDPSLKAVPIFGSTSGDDALTLSVITDYVGNKVYENNKLKRILIGNGYIEDGNYYFYVQDHLGNNRIVANAYTTVIQSNQYYPFGMIFAEGSATEQSKQPYKYNGKELDQMHGLNQYDYSARYYDPTVPRFTSMDPLSEKNYSFSPYVYVDNNPMLYIDPNGKEKLIFFNINSSDLEERQLERIAYAGALKEKDNNMIHIYAHGSPRQFTAYDSKGKPTMVDDANSLNDFLTEYSVIWQNKKDGELIFVVLHSCRTGRETFFESTNARTPSLAEDISGELTNTILIAPDQYVSLGKNGEDPILIPKYADRNGFTKNKTMTNELGHWNVFYLGGRLGSLKGNSKPQDASKSTISTIKAMVELWRPDTDKMQRFYNNETSYREWQRKWENLFY